MSASLHYASQICTRESGNIFRYLLGVNITCSKKSKSSYYRACFAINIGFIILFATVKQKVNRCTKIIKLTVSINHWLRTTATNESSKWSFRLQTHKSGSNWIITEQLWNTLQSIVSSMVHTLRPFQLAYVTWGSTNYGITRRYGTNLPRADVGVYSLGNYELFEVQVRMVPQSLNGCSVY